MNATFKTSIIFLIAIAFSACSNPAGEQEQRETGTISISISGSVSGSVSGNAGGGAEASRAGWAFPPTEAMLVDILHDVVLTGPGDRQTFTGIKYGGAPIKATVIEGDWRVHIEASYEGKPYATGTDWVKVIAGQDNGVTVQMRKAFEDGDPDCNHIGGEWAISAPLSAGIGVETRACTECGYAMEIRHFTEIDNWPPGLDLSPIASGANVGTYRVSDSGAEGDVAIPGWVHADDGSVTQVTTVGGGWSSFNSAITILTIHEGVTTIGDQAFQNCGDLGIVAIPNSVTSIGGSAFKGTGISSVTIPDSVTDVGSAAFAECASLDSLTIGKGVPAFSHTVFQNCISLRSITIPANVTFIHFSVFEGTSLDSVTFEGAGTDINDDNSFPNGASLRTAYAAGGAGTYVFEDPAWEKRQ